MPRSGDYPIFRDFEIEDPMVDPRQMHPRSPGLNRNVPEGPWECLVCGDIAPHDVAKGKAFNRTGYVHTAAHNGAITVCGLARIKPE